MGQSSPLYLRPYLYDTGMAVPEGLSGIQSLTVLVRLAAGTAVYLSTPRAGFLDGRFVFANYDMEKLEELKEKIVTEDLLKTRVIFGDSLGSAVIPPKKQ